MSHEEKIKKVSELIDSGRTGEAMVVSEELIKEVPGDERSWNLWGLAKERWEDYDSAIKGV